MIEPIENLYFNWLCAKVIYIKNATPSLTYWTLLKTLHKTEFAWFFDGDCNRASDGLYLRYEFLMEADIPNDPEWRRVPPCSVLEMLVALARRFEFQTDIPMRDCFWEFIDNLGLRYFNDASDPRIEEIQDILDVFIWRNYGPNGRGGLFPISNPRHDQSEKEIWYQMHAYLEDTDR